jgi:iron complex outermembrane receptor protein
LRSYLFTILVLAPATARADQAPATTDEELLRYIAEAEAEAEAKGEVITVEDTASPVDTPSGGVRVVSGRALELTPHKNADDLLRVVPGLYTSQHGSEGKAQQFFLRGFDAVHGSDVAIRVGGIPINELSNVHGQGYADLGFVVPETVSGLTSRKGPFDLEQGWFATAGSIDFALGVANRGKRVGYQLGTTNRHRLALVDAPTGGPEAQFVAVDLMHDDGYGQNRGSQHGTVIGQTEIKAGTWRVRPLITGYWGTFGEPGVVAIDDIRQGRFTRMDAPAAEQGGHSQRVLGGVNASYKRGADEIIASTYGGYRQLSISENFTGFLESMEFGDTRAQQHAAITAGGRFAWRHRITKGVRLLTGVDVAHDRIDQLEDRVTMQGQVWRNERSLVANMTSAGVWSGVEARAGRITATGGARLDAMAVDAIDRLDPMRSGDGIVGAVSPRLAVAWRGELLTVSAAAGRGQRPPEARAFTKRDSRENMDASVYDGGAAELTGATSVELGSELRTSKFAVGATGFATWIERESVFDHVSGVNALRDGSRRVGVELSIEAMPVSWLSLRGDVTAVDARFVVTDNMVPGAPRLLGSIEARYDAKPFSAGLAGRFLGARPLDHGATAAASTVVDAVAGWSTKRWDLTMSIDNVLGTTWNEGEYHFASHWDQSMPESDLPRVHISPGRPFGVRAGATLKF